VALAQAAFTEERARTEAPAVSLGWRCRVSAACAKSVTTWLKSAGEGVFPPGPAGGNVAAK